MKKSNLTILLIAALFCLDCSDNIERPAQILVTVSGECVCNVFIYTPEGLCLKSRIWDCEETNILIFDLYYEGPLTIKAEYKQKTASITITSAYGKTTEAGITL